MKTPKSQKRIWRIMGAAKGQDRLTEVVRLKMAFERRVCLRLTGAKR